MIKHLTIVVVALVLLTLILGWIRIGSLKSMSRDSFDALYVDGVDVKKHPSRIFHLGHSLVGRDMPAMFAQLSGQNHSYESQLGWGTSMRAHWEPDVRIKGFEQENAHPRYRDAHSATGSGDYDVLVLTESVEIRDAIKYHDSAEYLHRWAVSGWANNPNLHIYLYETWHDLDDPEGWLIRLDKDLGRYWEDKILRKALSYEGIDRPIYVIPAGQVLARLVQVIEANGGVGSVADRSDLFAITDSGEQDQIHLNDLGAYLVALTHYAVIYQKTPVGLDHSLLRADGSEADDPGQELAVLMQNIVWEVVSNYPKTGVSQGK